MDKNRSSFIIGLAAFLMWGTLPLFWRLMFYMNPYSVVSYRILSSLFFVALYITLTGRWSKVADVFRNKQVPMLFVCGFIVGTNWLIYIYALSKGMVMQTSMGYYINPLINVLFGAMFFKETMRPLQKVSVLLAAAGVLFMIIYYREIPYMGLLMALTFAMYGAGHKLVKANVADGMFYEMLAIAVPALIYLMYAVELPFYAEPLKNKFLIFMAGGFTVLPLLGFAFSVQNLRLSTVGMLQYISPTATFILSITAFGERFDPPMAVVFTFIWLGVLTYSLDALKFNSKKNR